MNMNMLLNTEYATPNYDVKSNVRNLNLTSVPHVHFLESFCCVGTREKVGDVCLSAKRGNAIKHKCALKMFAFVICVTRLSCSSHSVLKFVVFFIYIVTSSLF